MRLPNFFVVFVRFLLALNFIALKFNMLGREGTVEINAVFQSFSFISYCLVASGMFLLLRNWGSVWLSSLIFNTLIKSVFMSSIALWSRADPIPIRRYSGLTASWVRSPVVGSMMPNPPPVTASKAPKRISCDEQRARD